MEVDKVCFACFERLKKSKSRKLISLTGNHGTFQDMKTSPIFSNSSEPEAGILQESQPQDKVLGATVGSSLDSRILKSELVMERKGAFLHLQQCIPNLPAMHCTILSH